MAIEFIPNQTVLFTSDDQPCKNVDTAVYIQPLQQDDLLCIEWKNDPCGDNLYDCEEENLVINGIFASSTGWTLETGWAIGGSTLNCTPGNPGNKASSVVAITTSNYYMVSYTITSYTSGSVTVGLGDGAGVNVGTYRSSTGTFTEIIHYTDSTPTIEFISHFSDDFQGSIDTAVMYEISESCLTTDLGDGTDWLMNLDGSYTHLSTTNPLHTNAAPQVEQDNWYQVIYTLTDVTAGTLTPAWIYISDSSVHPFTPVATGNGTWVAYDTPGEDAELGFVPSADFDGTLQTSDLSIKLMNTDHAIQIIDMDDEVVSETISKDTVGNELRFSDNYMAICLNFDTINIVDVPGSKIPSGCYRIRVIDDCASTSTDSTTIINYKKTGEHRCTKFIEAYCNDYGHNFYFGEDGDFFKLTMRAQVLRISPDYPGENERYNTSTGRKQVLYTSREKQWTLWLGYMDEWAYDCFSTQRLCDVTLIEDVQYSFPDESFKPEWPENMNRNLAMARTTIEKIQSGISNRFL